MTNPKYNPEAELGVISALINDGDYSSFTVQKSMLRLEERFFYVPVHRELFKIIKKCFDEKHVFDMSAMSDILQSSSNDVFMTMLNGLNKTYYSTSRLEREITTLEQAAQMRQQLKTMQSIILDCHDEPLTNLACDILHHGIQKLGGIKLNAMNDGADYEQIAESHLNGEFLDMEPVEIGIDGFGELRNCSLVTIAGASGVGKTYFGVYLMNQVGMYQPDKQALFFSLEMARNEIWERHLSILADKAFNELTKSELTEAIGLSLAVDYRVYDEPRIDIDYIETMCRLQAMRKPISVIVVDYIGLVTSKQKHDREDLRVSDITQRLAALAMRLKCIVIGLTQVNRDPSKREKSDRCPYPNDVADSVGSVRSSSLWIGIDRPELYSDELQDKNLFVAKCRKNRRGINFEVYFDFNGGRFLPRDKPHWQSTPKPMANRYKFKKD